MARRVRPSWALLLSALFLAPAAQAQDEANPTYVVSYYRCDRGALEEVVERERERWMPIAQGLVNEGQLYFYGAAVHQWGDEWNYMTWMVARDIPAALAANEEGGRRYDAQYPDDDGSFFRERCPVHRDVFYDEVAATRGDGPAIDPENPPTLVLSFFSCDYGALDELVERDRTMTIPVAQELVDEGMLGFQGSYVHTWADEWNYVIARSFANIAAIDPMFEEFGRRAEARESGMENGNDLINRHCTAHKDNIYYNVLATTAPQN